MADSAYNPPGGVSQGAVPVAADRQPVVFARDGEVFATSRDVAAFFGKEHRSVLASIDALLVQEPALGLHSFMQTPYVEPSTGQTYRMYEMDRDGFTLLAMGFTGTKALKFKLRYIEAFKALEAEVQRLTNASTAVLSGPQLMAAALIEADATMKAQAKQIEVMAPKVEAYDHLMNADGLYGLQNAGRVLGARPNLFIRWLKQDYLFYQGQALVARVQHIQRGYFEVKTKIIDDKARPETFVTPKGLDHLRDKVPSELLIGGAA